MAYHPNGMRLTEHEAEVLIILMEECAEVTQAASKLLRFGKENRLDTGVSNVYTLSAEYGDLQTIADMARDLGLLSAPAVAEGRSRKIKRLAHFMQTSNG